MLESGCFKGEAADFELLRIDNDLGLVPVFVLIDGERTEYAGEIAIILLSID